MMNFIKKKVKKLKLCLKICFKQKILTKQQIKIKTLLILSFVNMCSKYLIKFYT